MNNLAAASVCGLCLSSLTQYLLLKKQRYYKRQSIQKRILICIWLPLHLSLSWHCKVIRRHFKLLSTQGGQLGRARDSCSRAETPRRWCDNDMTSLHSLAARWHCIRWGWYGSGVLTPVLQSSSFLWSDAGIAQKRTLLCQAPWASSWLWGALASPELPALIAIPRQHLFSLE